MRGDDLPVDVLLQGLLRHGRSIESAFPAFNGILLGGALLLAGRALAIDVPGTSGRVAAGGYLDGLAVVDTGGGPRQRPQALLDLRFDATASRALRGHVELRGRIGGPFEGGHPGVYNFNHEFQNRSPALEANEAWGELRLRRADLRLGIQKFAWGKLDGIPPTDVLNPRDFHDPLVQDVEERKIGIPALLGTYYLPDVARLDLSGLRASLIWVPLAVPSRLALFEERWFPRSTVPPPRFVLAPELLPPAFRNLFPGGLLIPVRFQTLNHHPPRQLETGGVALRIGGTWRESDWDLYHYTGPETGPNADLRPTLVLRSGRFPIRATSFLRQAHDVIHMTGADWAMPIGGVTVRAEVAHFVDRPYLRLARDLISRQALAALPLDRIARQLVNRRRATVPLGDLFPDRDSVEWGIGADTVVRGVMPLLQVTQVVLLEPAPRLLIADPETRFTGLVRRRFLGERLELEARGIYAAERGAWFAFPRASYFLRDDLRLRVGYLAVGGPRPSLLGQFQDNDEVVFQARWSF